MLFYSRSSRGMVLVLLLTYAQNGGMMNAERAKPERKEAVRMPARDGTGPLGMGPRTGWGRGWCRSGRGYGYGWRQAGRPEEAPAAGVESPLSSLERRLEELTRAVEELQGRDAVE